MYSNHCKAVEDWGNTWAAEKVAERLAERNVELAEKMIQKGNYSIEEICELSGLSKETVEELTEELKV
ncbi:MAG: hypothetical protein MJ183_00005, partial [Treponemataceae bacterium]|nr:hypothetical protein [Treponemataceae bacterium]